MPADRRARRVARHEDLRERLESGKVYPKERIETALHNFFTMANLSQLRELAMEEIAHRLGLSVKTIEAHRSQIMERLGIYDIPGLVRFAVRAGLISADR